MDARLAAIGALAALCQLGPKPVAAADLRSPPARCAALAKRMVHHWPESSTRLVLTQWVPAGPGPTPSPSIETPSELPDHCEVVGTLQERLGEGAQHYAIQFHLRLPKEWNGRLLFHGGEGSEGVLGDAWGLYSQASPPALAQGFAVLSEDSGHDNRTNDDPARGGVEVFGFDEKARANFGHASLPLVADAAKAAIKQFYGSAARHSYFVGCGKGGEEGMALAQRYPAQFDGIAAGAPGISGPRAVLAQAWDTQALASVVKTTETGAVTLDKLPLAFSNSDLVLVRTAVLAACDADDGLVDGIIGDYKRCTFDKVRPELESRRCVTAKTDNCLSTPELDALARVQSGAHDSEGEALYSDWPWDTGIAAPGWRVWKLGTLEGSTPSLDVTAGAAMLASVLSTPPTPVSNDPDVLFKFMMAFDFDRDAAMIYATNAEFPRSSWEDLSARSTDLAAFQRRAGKLMLIHGVSDPVFSIYDSIAWWRELNERSGGKAQEFARLFPVPGMTHCGGGDATDQFDVLASLVAWVEKDRAPRRIQAAAGPTTPWPQRTRPLCPYPSVARYKGSGDIDKAANFECVR